MKRYAIVISLNNGLSYEDNQVEPVAVATTTKKAEKWIEKNTPVTIEMYKKIFHTTPPDWASHIEFYTQEVEIIP